MRPSTGDDESEGFRMRAERTADELRVWQQPMHERREADLHVHDASGWRSLRGVRAAGAMGAGRAGRLGGWVVLAGLASLAVIVLPAVLIV